MILDITQEDLEFLNELHIDATTPEGDSLAVSLPQATGDWQPPDNVVDYLRKLVLENENEEFYTKMEEQTIRGTFNIRLQDGSV